MSIASSSATGQVEVTGVGTAEAALEAIAGAALRLRHRRSRPAGPAGRRADRAHPQDARRRGPADRRLYGPGPHEGAGAPARSGSPRRSSSRASGSSEKLLDETALFLHRAIAGDPGGQADHRRARRTTRSLDGRKVLIVDDDVRNIFSLTSALEQHGMEVVVRRERPRGHRDAEARSRTSTSCWSTS